MIGRSATPHHPSGTTRTPSRASRYATLVGLALTLSAATAHADAYLQVGAGGGFSTAIATYGETGLALMV